MSPDASANPLIQFFPFILIFAIFFFIVILPEKRKQAEHKAKLAKLQKNDQVITTSGIHGTIVNTKDATVVVRVDDNVKIEFDREAIAVVKNTSDTPAKRAA